MLHKGKAQLQASFPFRRQVLLIGAAKVRVESKIMGFFYRFHDIIGAAGHTNQNCWCGECCTCHTLVYTPGLLKVLLSCKATEVAVGCPRYCFHVEGTVSCNTHCWLLIGRPLNGARKHSYTSYLSHITRKPVFGVCHQLRLKLACSAAETN